MESRRYFPALTGVRGYAALWVFLFHAFDGLALPGIERGYLGVDLFFVLSGFIIALVHHADFEGPGRLAMMRRFMALRFARIYPLHGLTLLALGVLVLLVPSFTGHYPPAAFSPFNFVANLLLVQTWVIPVIPPEMRGPGWSWNGPAWSLSAEWLLYLLFPAIIVVLKRVRATGGLLAIGLLSLAGTAACHWLGIELAGLPRALGEFVAGVTIFLACSRLEHRFAGWDTLAAVGLAGLAVSAAGGALEYLAPLACFALVAGLAYGTGPITRLLAARPSVVLGDVSLALYLVHWPLLQVWNHVIRPSEHAAERIGPAYIAYLAAIMALSYALHRWFEVPARTGLRHALLRRRIARPSDPLPSRQP